MHRMTGWLVLWIVMLPLQSWADRQMLNLSTGFNPTSLHPEFNRGTALQAEVARDWQLYQLSFDSHGLFSFGLGRIASATDFQRETGRYPMVTAFVQPERRPGLELKFHEEWFWFPHLSGGPRKVAHTLFETEAGVVWEAGRRSRVRVAHRFTTTRHRHPGRSQGAEWVWEFRDEPNVEDRSMAAGTSVQPTRQNSHHEEWFFISRELGIGVVRLQVGATHKTVARTPGSNQVSSNRPGWQSFRLRRPTTREPVLMLRIEYIIRRWS